MNETAFLQGAVPPPSNLPVNQGGRPTDYDPTLALRICEEIADGATLRRICGKNDIPVRSTVFKWLTEHEDFQKQYVLALQLRFDARADEILDIADDKDDDFILTEMPDGPPVVRENRTAIARSTLQIETRQWLMAKEAPRKYGDFRPETAPAPLANGDGAKEVQTGPAVIENDPLHDSLLAWEKAVKVPA